MSNLVVPLAKIEEISPHPEADRLELARVLGWQVVVRKGEYKPGQEVVYFPPDTVLPGAVSDMLGVTNYLSKGRVRCARLRGEASFGFVAKPTREWGKATTNLASAYGATKYEPPFRPTAGDALPPHPLFVNYTEIENLRNCPDIFREGELVVISEKIHGTNSRVGLIKGEEMAGSKKVRRKRPDDDALRRNVYWYPWIATGVEQLLHHLGRDHRQIILFGEVYGKVQSLDYGVPDGLGYRAFDLMIDGRYLDWWDFEASCSAFGVATVPVLARGIEYSLNTVREYSEGSTKLNANHIREGVVVRPRNERHNPRVGRVIMKYVSDTYLFGDETDYTDE